MIDFLQYLSAEDYKMASFRQLGVSRLTKMHFVMSVNVTNIFSNKLLYHTENINLCLISYFIQNITPI